MCFGGVHALMSTQVLRPRESCTAETTMESFLLQVAQAVVVLKLPGRLEHLRTDWASAGAPLAIMDLDSADKIMQSQIKMKSNLLIIPNLTCISPLSTAGNLLAGTLNKYTDFIYTENIHKLESHIVKR